MLQGRRQVKGNNGNGTTKMPKCPVQTKLKSNQWKGINTNHGKGANKGVAKGVVGQAKVWGTPN